MSRVWSLAEQNAAKAITVVLGTEESFTGGYALGVKARVAGAGHKAIKGTVERVMPLVTEYVVSDYPGKRLKVETRGGGLATYSLELDSEPSLTRQAVTRTKAAATKTRRAQYEFPVGTPEGRLAATTAQVLSDMFEAASVVFQAAHEAAQRAESTQHTDTEATA